jgi:hypothetical protein
MDAATEHEEYRHGREWNERQEKAEAPPPRGSAQEEHGKAGIRGRQRETRASPRQERRELKFFLLEDSPLAFAGGLFLFRSII